jgi:hypothetical protein
MRLKPEIGGFHLVMGPNLQILFQKGEGERFFAPKANCGTNVAANSLTGIKLTYRKGT